MLAKHSDGDGKSILYSYRFVLTYARLVCTESHGHSAASPRNLFRFYSLPDRGLFSFPFPSHATSIPWLVALFRYIRKTEMMGKYEF